jgi:predicted amidohydrolase
VTSEVPTVHKEQTKYQIHRVIMNIPPPPPPMNKSGIPLPSSFNKQSTQQATSSTTPPPPPPMSIATQKKHKPSLSQQKDQNTSDNNVTMNPEFIITDPDKDSYEPHDYTNIKVLLIQYSARMGREDEGVFVENKILESMKQDNRVPDFVLFPELYIGEKSELHLDKNNTLKSISNVLAKYRIYGILGSMVERHSVRYYNTCVFMNRDGTILGSYRKRHLVKDGGDRVGIYDTSFGRVAVLICYDIENKDCLNETLAYDPIIIFNPTLIAARSLSNSGKSAELTSWYIAMSSMSRQFENLCIEKQCTVIRCDMPGNPLGSNAMGTSQCISPYSTIYAPTRFPAIFNIYVDKVVDQSVVSAEKRALLNDYSRLTNPPTYIRSEQNDNVGNRYRLHTFESHTKPFVPDHICFFDSKVMFAATKQQLFMYKVFNRELQFIVSSFESDIVAMTASTKHLFTACKNGELHIWKVNELKSFELLKSVQIPTNTTVTVLQPGTVNNKPVILCGDEQGTIALFDIVEYQFTKEWKVSDGSIRCIECIGQLSFICDNKDSTAIKIWDLNKECLIHTLNHTDSIVALKSLAVKDNCLVSIDSQGQISVWNIQPDFSKIATSSITTSNEISGVQPINSNYIIISYLNHQAPELFDVSQGKVVHQFHPQVGAVASKGVLRMAFDGVSLLSIVSDNPDCNIALYEFISNQIPTKFNEIFNI